MLLTSVDGALVDLRIAGYQYPRRSAVGKQDWDANWLNLRGDVTLADGRTWSFEDPCLTTWEARQLGDWLQAAAAGLVPVSAFGTDEPEGRLLAFTEPNLAFSLECLTGDQATVRVHLSLEALPPWQPSADFFDYVVLVQISTGELADAAASWMRNLADYPER
jgi:hypothetical protein